MDAVAEFTSILQFFKAMANKSRLQLIGLVSQGEHNVQQLASCLDLSEPTVSHHLGMLKRLGLVSMRNAGTTHWYALDAEALTRLAQSVLSKQQVAALAPLDPPAATILKNFVSPDGRLIQIPASRKKRLVILAWLIEKFEPGRSYGEIEISDVLKRHHDDPATLRRELVGYRMMVRENGQYRRMPADEWESE